MSLTPEEQAQQAAALEQGRLLFAKECTFFFGSSTLAQMPPATLPEVAFIGRSNVGKSSLINALTNRNTLARTSNTPGRTQQLNFFNLGERLVLVDMPGYGFAQAPLDVVKRWHQLVSGYLRGRVTLRRTLVLIDARHGLKPVDDETLDLFDKSAVNYQIVLTKTDKVKPGPLALVVEQTAERIKKRVAAHPVIHVTSSETGAGIPELRAELLQFAKPAIGA